MLFVKVKLIVCVDLSQLSRSSRPKTGADQSLLTTRSILGSTYIANFAPDHSCNATHIYIVLCVKTNWRCLTLLCLSCQRCHTQSECLTNRLHYSHSSVGWFKHRSVELTIILNTTLRINNWQNRVPNRQRRCVQYVILQHTQSSNL